MTKGKTITVDLWKGPVKNEQLLEMTVAAREDDEGNPFDDNEEFGEFGIKVWNSGDVLKATIEAIATATLQGNAQVVLKGGDGGQYRFRLIVEKTQPEITRTSRATAGEKKRRALKDALRPVIPPTEGGKNSRARDTLQPDAKAPHEAPLTHEKKVEWFTVEYRKRHGTVWNVLKMSALWREMYGEEMPDYHDILP